MAQYRVVKSHLNWDNTIYSKGNVIELSDVDGSKLWKVDGCVIPVTEDRLPTVADGLFKELQGELAAVKKELEESKAENLRLTEELIQKTNAIEHLNAKKK